MDTLHTIEVPQRGEYKIVAPTDELAILHLQERMRDEVDDDDDLISITPAMITGRESHPGMDEFYARYQFVKNPASEGNGEPQECMYETYGSELAFVREQTCERIWTLIEEDGVLWLIAGYRHVNRLGYFITTGIWQDAEETYLYGG